MNYYINREISWLKFNKRVLDEADSETVPHFERLKFIYIFSNNLDEFFMVRAGSLEDRSLLINEPPDNKTGMTAREQLDALRDAAAPLYGLRDDYYFSLKDNLTRNGIRRLSVKELNSAQAKTVRRYFRREVLPLLSPYIIGVKHPFPHLENKRMYILASLASGEKSCYGILPVPNMLNRIFYLGEEAGSISGILIEDIILKYAGEIFKQYKVTSRAVVRVTRNADIEVADNFSDEDVDYRDYVGEIIKKREKLAPVRLEYYSGSHLKCGKLINFCLDKIKLAKKSCYHSKSPLDFSYVFELEDKIRALGSFPHEIFYSPLTPKNLVLNPLKTISQSAAERDIFLSYPYYNMKPYLRMLEEAALDESVVSIKITLYRLSNNSEVIRLLCLAAENGREVVALVELKARFDESNNINWSRRLEEAGCHVIYGVESLKVHSKITLITRKNGEQIRRLAHLGTGNYNERTAKLYTDVGIITSDSRICSDAVIFFKNMSLGLTGDEYQSLLVAPAGLKRGIIAEIRAEAAKAALGQPSYICFKLNGLTDKEIIDELAAASRVGVPVDLIIRGICCLLPRIPGETENIRVVSVVGRFLEHSRIFIFGGDTDRAAGQRRTYIGSADLMTRNTSRRIEIITPIYDAQIADHLYELTRASLRDNVKASVLLSNGTYERVATAGGPIDSQIYLFGQSTDL